MSKHKLRRYPRVRELFAEQASRSQHEEELLLCVQAAREQLEAAGEPITRRAISRVVSLPLSRLYNSPRVVVLLKELAHQRHQERVRREDELAQRVVEKIASLKGLGEEVTVKAIARSVQASESTLKRIPRIRQLLAQVVLERRLARGLIEISPAGSREVATTSNP